MVQLGDLGHGKHASGSRKCFQFAKSVNTGLITQALGQRVSACRAGAWLAGWRLSRASAALVGCGGGGASGRERRWKHLRPAGLRRFHANLPPDRQYMDGFKLPYGMILGNHDLEGDEFQSDEENLAAWKEVGRACLCVCVCACFLNGKFRLGSLMYRCSLAGT